MSETNTKRRTVRSFVRRTGRVTPGQTKAMRELWPVYGLEFRDEPLQFPEIFGRTAPVFLDVGFGNGESLIDQARQNPDVDYLGVEVHEPGVGHCLMAARDAGITNLKVIMHDVVDVLREQIPDASLSGVSLLFPDPWPKKRHHKRRLVNTAFLNLLANKLQQSGSVLIATDWEHYAAHIDQVTAMCDRFRISERREHSGDKPLLRTTTKFEQRGLRRGHRIWDWQLTRTSD